MPLIWVVCISVYLNVLRINFESDRNRMRFDGNFHVVWQVTHSQHKIHATLKQINFFFLQKGSGFLCMLRQHSMTFNRKSVLRIETVGFFPGRAAAKLPFLNYNMPRAQLKCFHIIKCVAIVAIYYNKAVACLIVQQQHEHWTIE